MKYTHDQWKEIIDGFETSGLTMKEYCRKHTVSTSRFCVLRKRMREQETPFLPVIMKAENSMKFRVNGHLIEIMDEVDPKLLSLILKAAKYD
ncbi:hypothetical protein AOC36_00945 [Erysipelothrix larvae]|uniref:Transposase n=1 Tax=Erysipelothrix larvae TaxID=1514105 RepID=A0A0X8GYL4_9FIRM|nr:hypothetical protein [Erysipelothrix larvae]AMC92609.1 hypothetical protein AOC36_00945 [Erysipelothrix larvae]